MVILSVISGSTASKRTKEVLEMTGDEYAGKRGESGGEEGRRGEHHAFRGVFSPHGMRTGRFPAGIITEMRALAPGSFGHLLRPAILLLLAEESMHGYELVVRLKELGVARADMDPSMVYRILRMLERAGMATSSLDDSGAGPARKVYSLTPDGMEMLDLWAANLEETMRLLDELKARYEGLGRGRKRAGK